MRFVLQVVAFLLPFCAAKGGPITQANKGRKIKTEGSPFSHLAVLFCQILEKYSWRSTELHTSVCITYLSNAVSLTSALLHFVPLGARHRCENIRNSFGLNLVSQYRILTFGTTSIRIYKCFSYKEKRNQNPPYLFLNIENATLHWQVFPWRKVTYDCYMFYFWFLLFIHIKMLYYWVNTKSKQDDTVTIEYFTY